MAFSLNDVPLKVRGRSGFNKDHRMCSSSSVGTLVPVLADEVIPGSRVSVKGALKANLFPLASDVFMDLEYKLEGFFVPYRILYGGFEDAIIGKSIDNTTMAVPTNQDFIGQGKYYAAIPRVVSNMQALLDRNYTSAGSLSDFLGFKTSKSPAAAGSSSTHYMNIFPFLAYHMCYDQYYRNPVVQTPVFAHVNAYEQRPLSTLPFRTDAVQASARNIMGNVSGTTYALSDVFRDGCALGSLRQRNFGDDYFTTARYSVQYGPQPSLGLALPVDSNNVANGSITIADIRSLNALTQFCERHGIAGTDFDRWVASNYDVHPTANNHVVFLGHDTLPVYSNSVMQQANNTYGASSTTTGASVEHANPFATVGAKYGDAQASGQFHICDDFLVTEPGIVLVIASLVPRVMYGTGMRRQLTHFNENGWIADIANALLESAGPQPIYKRELDVDLVAGDFANEYASIFGYTDRYAEFKTMLDEVHGLMRDGEQLDMFVLQRDFKNSGPAINANFLRIPTDYLAQVQANQDATFLTKFGLNAPDDRGVTYKHDHILDMWFDYKVSMPLSRYAIPSLVTSADNGSETVVIPRK